MNHLLGENAEHLFVSIATTPPVSVRLHPRRMITAFSNSEAVEWCKNGRYLEERPSFTLDPLFHAGCYYVQEAGSMFIEQIWNVINPDLTPLRVLDLCAAPGGKSTHLLSLMNGDGTLVTNEIVPNRNAALRQNIIKWGYANCMVTQNEPVDFEKVPEFFDVVLVDAPCSGEGMFRKDKTAVKEWSEENVTRCSLRQQTILDSAICTLKPGGFLIYSTCTYEPLENDNQVKRVADKFGMQLLKLHFPGVTATDYGLQFYPHLNKCEGFYISVLQKPLTEKSYDYYDTKKHANSIESSALKIEWIEDKEELSIYKKGDTFFLFTDDTLRTFRYLNPHLFIKLAGTRMGEVKGKDFIPDHSLALSLHKREDLQAIELSKEAALRFLKSETVQADKSSKGWSIASFEGNALGWLKVLDNRINNYFPKEWRILKDIP